MTILIICAVYAVIAFASIVSMVAYYTTRDGYEPTSVLICMILGAVWPASLAAALVVKIAQHFDRSGDR